MFRLVAVLIALATRVVTIRPPLRPCPVALSSGWGAVVVVAIVVVVVSELKPVNNQNKVSRQIKENKI